MQIINPTFKYLVNQLTAVITRQDNRLDRMLTNEHTS